MTKTTKENCIICDGNTKYFFTKEYDSKYSHMLTSSIFSKCENCGFTFSNTLFNMDDNIWNKLNEDFHLFLENPKDDSNINQPPYIEQANMLNILINNDIINRNMIDYAGGMGTLSKILNRYFNIDLPVYDPYIKDIEDSSVMYMDSSNLTKVDVLINSALFEHIRSIDDLNDINSLVSDSGVMIIHTVICEDIPEDPNWFYFTPPVHCAIHSNKSMGILMKNWGYVSSIYCKSAKCWILFKKEPNALMDLVDSINSLLQTDYFIYKKGFVDYWK